MKTIPDARIEGQIFVKRFIWCSAFHRVHASAPVLPLGTDLSILMAEASPGHPEQVFEKFPIWIADSAAF